MYQTKRSQRNPNYSSLFLFSQAYGKGDGAAVGKYPQVQGQAEVEEKLKRAIGLEHIQFHDLKYTFATLPLKNEPNTI